MGKATMRDAHPGETVSQHSHDALELFVSALLVFAFVISVAEIVNNHGMRKGINEQRAVICREYPGSLRDCPKGELQERIDALQKEIDGLKKQAR